MIKMLQWNQHGVANDDMEKIPPPEVVDGIANCVRKARYLIS